MKEYFPDSTHSEFHDLDERNDKEIWEFCKKFNYMIVTKDKDFIEFSILYQSPPKVILIRTGNCSTEVVKNLLIINYETIKEFYNSRKINCLFLH